MSNMCKCLPVLLLLAGCQTMADNLGIPIGHYDEQSYSSPYAMPVAYAPSIGWQVPEYHTHKSVTCMSMSGGLTVCQ